MSASSVRRWASLPPPPLKEEKDNIILKVFMLKIKFTSVYRRYVSNVDLLWVYLVAPNVHSEKELLLKNDPK
jgi:hypothetical protein